MLADLYEYSSANIIYLHTYDHRYDHRYSCNNKYHRPQRIPIGPHTSLDPVPPNPLLAHPDLPEHSCKYQHNTII